MLRSLVRSLVLCSASLLCAAERPTLDHLFPLGAERGATNEITFLGKFEPWPPKAWVSVPGVEFQFTTNKGKGQVVIAQDAPAGPCLVRLFSDEGPSDPRIFVVADRSETLEIEPNNHFGKAQALTNLPGTVNGRLEKNGDVDSFSFPIKAGQWLDARLDSYTLLAKLDPVLRLVTTNGYQLAWNHDFASLDPRIIWQAPYDLTAVIQVFGFVYPADADIRLSGGSAGGYRLHLAIGARPPADIAEAPTEAEPNDGTNNAPAVELPVEKIGVISPSGDVDRFRIDLKKDQDLEVAVRASARGSILDAWLAIENSSGKELARNDDADNSRDPRLEWKVPEDGTYYFVVGSTTHQGGVDCRYHLVARALAPDYRIVSAADLITLTIGGTNSLKLNFKRLRGFTNELTAVVKDLPVGVQVNDVRLPEKDGEVSLAFIALTNAMPTNRSIAVTITDKQSSQTRVVPFELVSRTENNGVPGGYTTLQVERVDQLWLTVKGLEQKEPKK